MLKVQLKTIVTTFLPPASASEQENMFYQQIMHIIDSCETDEQLHNDLSRLLGSRWKNIKSAGNDYFQHQNHWLNQLCLRLAFKLNPTHPYTVLIPDLVGKSDTFGNSFEDLGIHNFIPAADGEFFIAAADFFSLFWQRAMQGEANACQYIDSENNPKALEETEKNALIKLIPGAANLFEKAALLTKDTDKSSLLNKLEMLRKGLLEGDVSHEGAEMEAAAVAHEAIAHFYTFYKALPASRKKKLRALTSNDGKSVLGSLLNRLFKPLEEVDSNGARYCIEMIGRGVEGIINNHAEQLREEDVDEDFSLARKAYKLVEKCIANPLFSAIVRDNLLEFFYHIESDTLSERINSPVNDTQETLLYVAAKHNSKQITDLLLNTVGISLESKSHHETPLFAAAQEGHKDIVQTLISKGTSIHTPCTTENITALYAAVKGKHFSTASLLLDMGANANTTRPCDGMTALHLAAKNNDLALMCLLIAHGANLHAVTRQGYTLLHYAAKLGHVEIAEFLITHKSPVDATTYLDSTPLHLAATNGHFDMVNLLLDNGAKVNSLGTKGNTTPLFLAMEKGYLNISILLLIKGANIRCDRLTDGLTPLHIAAKNGHKELVCLALSKGISVDVKSVGDKNTALHLATLKNDLSMIKLLLENNATIDSKNKKRQTPVFLAVKRNNITLVKFFIENGADINQLNEEDGESLLYTAAKYDYLVIAHYLITKKAEINKPRKKDGASAIFVAADQNHTSMVMLLLTHGANINQIRITDGATPLYIAAQNGDYRMVELLLDEKADIDMSFMDNYATPLHIAAYRGHHKIVKLLLSYNANHNLQTREIDSALDLAKDSGNRKAVKYIQEQALKEYVADVKRQGTRYYEPRISFFGYPIGKLSYSSEQYLEAAEACQKVVAGTADQTSLENYQSIINNSNLGSILP